MAKKQRAELSAVITIVMFVAVVFGVFFITKKLLPQEQQNNNTNAASNADQNGNAAVVLNINTGNQFENVPTSGLVSSTPRHGDVLSEVPSSITVAFSSPLGPSSTLAAYSSSEEALQLGRGQFSDDRLSMTVGLSSAASRTVNVRYSACSADNTVCEEGTFSFAIRAN